MSSVPLLYQQYTDQVKVTSDLYVLHTTPIFSVPLLYKKSSLPLISCIFLSCGLAPSDMVVGPEGLDRADPPLSASIFILYKYNQLKEDKN